MESEGLLPAPGLLCFHPMRIQKSKICLILVELVVALVVALVAAGCSTTKLSSVWVDANYTGGAFRKLMIIGLGASEGGRAAFENSVADAFREQGVVGVSSTGYFASADEMTREGVRSWADRDGYDGVLISRVVDVDRQQHVVGPTYTDLWGYWGYYGTVMTSPGYVSETTTMRITTDLFDASTGKVVYTAESKTFEPNSRAKTIRELTAMISEDLTARGFLPQK